MAAIGTLKTLVDWSKEVDPDGSTSAVAEVMSQTNQIVDTALFKEGNLPTGEQVGIRTGLPTTYWRLMNTGVPSSKATSAQVTESCGSLTARSEVDCKIAKLNGNSAQFRLNEGRAFMESMAQEFASTMFYGSASSPAEFVGLANRYNDLSANNAENILSAGGSSSDNTSIYLVGWGENEVYGIFPKGSKAGIQHKDLGEIDAFDENNNRFRALADYYEWDGGLVVKDWRYAGRIPNIDVSDLVGLTGTQALTASTSIIKLMARLIHRLPNIAGVKPVFYANRTVASHLTMVALEKSSSVVTIENAINQFGKEFKQLKFLDIPIGISDALTNSEAAVA
jgi:hypothetical protein